jgi:hypothetical protein
MALAAAAWLAAGHPATARAPSLLGLCPANAARADSYTQVLCEGESALQAGDARAALERFRFAAALPRLDASHELAWAGLAAAHCRSHEFESGRQWAERFTEAHRLWRGELDCQRAPGAAGPRLSDYVRDRMCTDTLAADYAAALKNPQAAHTVDLHARLQQVADGLAQLCPASARASADPARAATTAATDKGEKAAKKKRPRRTPTPSPKKAAPSRPAPA